VEDIVDTLTVTVTNAAYLDCFAYFTPTCLPNTY
jgi:hypothetical protein